MEGGEEGEGKGRVGGGGKSRGEQGLEVGIRNSKKRDRREVRLKV